MSVLPATSATSSLLGASRLNVSGLATGLDTEKIITGLLAIEQAKIAKLEARQTRVQQQQAAYKGIEARLLALQAQITQLARSQNSVFDTRIVSSSNEGLVTAAATSSATPGSYQVQVNSLARAHQIIAQGFDSANSLITQGTFQIRVGSGATATITIDGSNNTLQGLASAINAAGAGVTASVINDGSATQPYRLLLTATKGGASNAIVITNNLAADVGGAVKPVFDGTFIGAASLSTGYTGTSTPTSIRAAGYTGASNNTYTFTVLAGGTVGTDNNLQVAYSDISGANTGTITLNAGDVGTFQTVAQGIQVSFAAGTLVAGQTFTIDGYVPQVQQAADASVRLGSGPGALTVTSATNQIDGLFGGLTLNLQGADPTKLVTLTVANDTDKISASIVDFVETYNDLLEFIDDQVKFDSESNRAGILLGDRQATTVQEQVRSAMTRPVQGLSSLMNRLSALGITTTDQGRLVVNQGKLDDALGGRLTGVTLDDVRRLFTLSGTTSVPGIQFVTGSTKTKSSAAPYQVTVTQAAEQALIAATNSLAVSTVLDGTNNTFTITVDGAASSTITLAPGTYTRLALVQEVQAQINANAALIGRRVTASLNGDRLVLTSNTYGSASKVAIGTGSALTPLGFAGTETAQGRDVAGYYTVAGVVEPAIGSGQFLAGQGTNANTADLQVRITLTPSQIGAGITSDVTVTRGVASMVDLTLGGLLDPVTGRMKTINDAFQSQIDDIEEIIARQNETMTARRESLLRQFVALERTVSELQGLGNFLTNQLSQITALGSNQGS